MAYALDDRSTSIGDIFITYTTYFLRFCVSVAFIFNDWCRRARTIIEIYSSSRVNHLHPQIFHCLRLLNTPQDICLQILNLPDFEKPRFRKRFRQSADSQVQCTTPLTWILYPELCERSNILTVKCFHTPFTLINSDDYNPCRFASHRSCKPKRGVALKPGRSTVSPRTSAVIPKYRNAT